MSEQLVLLLRQPIKDGLKGCVRPPEVRAKISAAKKGVKFSAAHREAIGAAQRGRKQSPESVEKRAASQRGKKRGPRPAEHIEKSAASKRGIPLSELHRARISAANRGRTKSPEHIEKIRAAHIAMRAAIVKTPAQPRALVERKRWLKKKYGLEVADYLRMVEEQGGLCAICRGAPSKKGLHVDHCHKSGKIRALLCFHCNAMLGNCRERLETLLAGIAYLEKHC